MSFDSSSLPNLWPIVSEPPMQGRWITNNPEAKEEDANESSNLKFVVSVVAGAFFASLMLRS